MNQLSGFDPLKFLDLKDLKNEEKDILSDKLLNKISQYLLIRVAELLQEEEIKRLNNPNDVFSLAKNKIPDLNNKVKLFLEDFKTEFYKNLKTR